MLGSIFFIVFQGAFALRCNQMLVLFVVLQPIRTLCSKQFFLVSYATDFIVYVHRNAEGLQCSIYNKKFVDMQTNQSKGEVN